MLFWLSILCSFLCILKTKDNHPLNRWDALFFLSSWETFNWKIWQRYLADATAYPYEISSLLCLLLACLYLLRRNIRIDISVTYENLKYAALYIVVLSLLLIPVGLHVGFLRFHPRLEIAHVENTVISYFLFVAPVEELMFRGLVFNLLRRAMDAEIALLYSTLLFATAYSHISGGGVFPNIPYAAMAFVAGGVYGLSYMKTRTLAVPILIHGTVDTIWRIFLT